MSDTEKSASTETGSMPLQHMANAIRALSMDAVQAANSGHPGLPMGPPILPRFSIQNF